MPSYDYTPWPVKDVSLFKGRLSCSSVLTCLQIVYTAIVGTVMGAALLEWFLWLSAFLYCLVKVYQKAEHWSVNVLAVVVGTVFTLLRLGPPGIAMGWANPEILSDSYFFPS